MLDNRGENSGGYDQGGSSYGGGGGGQDKAPAPTETFDKDLDDEIPF